MSIRNCFTLALVLLGAQILLSGQTPPTQGTGTDTGNDPSRATPAPALSGVMGIDSQMPIEDTSGTLPQIPALLGGPRLSVALRSESERSNYLNVGVNVGATYDDNALLTPHNTLDNTAVSVFPSISLEQTRSRMSWKLGYASGLTVNQNLSNRNQWANDLNLESQFRLSPHVNLRVAEDFSLTSGGFFDSGNSNGVGVGSGGPNANLLAPLSEQMSSSTVVQTNYHFALNDVLGASGAFYSLHFSNAPAGVTLTDSRSASGSAFWLHGFGRDWVGVNYNFQRLTYTPSGQNSGGETRLHTILAINTFNLPNRFTLTAFLGPEYSENQGLVPTGENANATFNAWSYTGGIEVGWQQNHTSVAAGYSRRISDGSGVLGVVRLQGLHGEMRQQLRPGWAVGAGASYGHNNSVTVPSAGSAERINSASIGVALERNLGKSFALRAGYAHDFQEQFGTTNTSQQGAAHRNRFSVTLGYQWSRSLGR